MIENFYNNPISYKKSMSKLLEIQRKYNVSPIVVGTSVLGRKIYGIPIGNPKNATLYVGGVHGLEWITSLVLYKFCEDILYSKKHHKYIYDINISKIFESRGVIIVPCLNPDGIEISIRGKKGALHLGNNVEKICNGEYGTWQSNANGVDLNHNFDAGWNTLKEMELALGIDAPSPTKYGGESPFSEPETKAIAKLCHEYNIRQLYAFHSQGEEIYYKYGDNTPSRSQLIAQVLASSCDYQLVTPTSTASHGGLKDWFIETFCRPGFTFELGKGQNPLPIESFYNIYNNILEALVLCIII